MRFYKKQMSIFRRCGFPQHNSLEFCTGFSVMVFPGGPEDFKCFWKNNFENTCYGRARTRL